MGTQSTMNTWGKKERFVLKWQSWGKNSCTGDWQGSRYEQAGIRRKTKGKMHPEFAWALRSGHFWHSQLSYLPNPWRPEVITNSCNSLFSSEIQTHTLLGSPLALLIRFLPFPLHLCEAHPFRTSGCSDFSGFLFELNCQILAGWAIKNPSSQVSASPHLSFSQVLQKEGGLGVLVWLWDEIIVPRWKYHLFSLLHSLA